MTIRNEVLKTNTENGLDFERQQKDIEEIYTLKDVELGKWYQTDREPFQFIEDTTEGYLRGKIRVDVEWNYRTEIFVPINTLSGRNISLKVLREGDTFSLRYHNIREYDIKRFVEEQEYELRKMRYNLKKEEERTRALNEKFGLNIKI